MNNSDWPFYDLSTGLDTATGNMARDLHLLDHFVEARSLRFRSYGWLGEAFTFGYAQKHSWILTQIPSLEAPPQLIRRPTGGGLVDHRHDWTYALVLPAGHPAHHGPAEGVYAKVHAVLAEAVSAHGIPATLASARPANIPSGLQGQCFASPEPCDAILTGTTRKIAGAAMKRNRHGLLLQGSMDKSLVPAIRDWEAFTREVCQGFARAFEASAPLPFPEPPHDEEHLRKLREHFSSEAWNRRR
jgi:lipoyl(octanoyl) transferase